MKLLCFVLLFGTLVSAIKNWEEYKLSHGKNYGRPPLEALRKELFLKVDAKIKKHNSENHSWKMGHNFLSDLTDEEKEKLHGTKEPSQADLRSISFQIENNEIQNSMLIRQSADLPLTVDYRNDPCMAPVKAQGYCGCCWSFSALNPVEFAQCKKKKSIDSLKQLVDCVYGTIKSGCSPGWHQAALNYLYSIKGAASSSLYPYVAKWVNGTCRYDPSMSAARLLTSVAISHKDFTVRVKMMQAALINHSTISVVIFAAPDWGSYKSGIYSNTTNCDRPFNHGVTIVGYGTENGIDYWVVRNSWGPNWGDKGYILMKRGINQCRIEGVPIYVTVE